MTTRYVTGSWPKRPGSPLDDGPMRARALALIRSGYSQQDVAAKLGCTSRTLIRWLNRDDEARQDWEAAEQAREDRYFPWEHGTVVTYNRHLRNAEDPCRACTDANTLAHRAYIASLGRLVIPIHTPILEPGRYPRGPETRRKMREAHQGERSSLAKLTNEAVDEIRRRRRSNPPESYQTLAEHFGVSVGTVWNAATGRSWSHRPGAVK